jgi:putative SOS response-associated peptidase YedK
MCGRYTLFRLEQLLNLFPWLAMPPGVVPRYNIAPSQPILAVSNEKPTQLDYYYWGLIPSWAKDRSIGNRMINARAETLAQKPAFRTALQRRRCLIPADGFYEWRKEPDGSKTPIHLQTRSGDPFMFAGLWDRWHDPDGSVIPSCTIITTPPNSLVEPIHDRMPAIVTPEDYQKWLSGPDPASVLRPYPPELMKATPVSKAVNNPRNESRRCIESVEEPGLWSSE